MHYDEPPLAAHVEGPSGPPEHLDVSRLEFDRDADALGPVAAFDDGERLAYRIVHNPSRRRPRLDGSELRLRLTGGHSISGAAPRSE